jgi:predicted  nucleic acid-binding Zn-ribbon protein
VTMRPIAAKLKSALASLEVTTKSLLALDADCTELAAVEALLDARRNELSEAEARLADAGEEIVRTGAALRQEQERFAAQSERNHQAIAEQEAQLQDLNVKIEAAQAKNDNLISALRSLRDKIGLSE